MAGHKELKKSEKITVIKSIRWVTAKCLLKELKYA